MFVVLGGGAMGSLFAGLLADGGAPVTLLDRHADHVDAIRASGLTIRDEDGDSRTVAVRATTDPDAAGRADRLVVAVKSYDTAAAMRAAAPCYDDGTAVATLQNGLGNAETLAEFVPAGRVLAMPTEHGATREAPGVVRHAGAGPTRLGRYVPGAEMADGERAIGRDEIDAVASTLRAGGVETTVVADARDAVWEKVLVNVGINAATALAGVENGALPRSDAGRRVVRQSVAEAAAVARAAGRSVPEDAADRALDVARATATNHSSMRRDVERGRRTEIRALNGAVVERGREYGISTPVNRTLTDLVTLASETGADERSRD